MSAFEKGEVVATHRTIGGFGPRARHLPIRTVTVHRRDCRMLTATTATFDVPGPTVPNVRPCRVCRPYGKATQ